jgi:hypothetical protein
MDRGWESKNGFANFWKALAITIMILMISMSFSALIKIPENADAEMSGPDYYGYRWIDSNPPEPKIDYNWIEISGSGTSVGSLGDESTYGPFSLGFTFDLYGNSYTEIWINNNGFLMFTNQSGVFAGNNPIPDSAPPNNIVAPFWDDLSEQGDIYYKTMGVGPNRYFVVEWKDVENYNIPGVGYITFEMILYEGSNLIKYQYQDVIFGDPLYDYGASATVGIENITGFGGLQYSYDNATLSNSMAIEIMSYPVDYIIINDTAGPGGNWVGDKIYSGGESDNFYAHGFNNIIGYMSDVSVEWISSNTSVGTVTSSGASTTFQAVGEGTCVITATYDGSLTNETGIITVFVVPEIKYVMYQPDYPNGTSPVTVYADITDSDGIQNAILYYSYDGVSYTPVDMNLAGGDTYSGDIPAPGSTSTVYFYINATDNNDNLNSSSVFSYLADAKPPEFDVPRREPEYPNSTENVDIKIGINDDYQISDATLFYSYDGSSWNSQAMTDIGSGTFYEYYVDFGPEGWIHYPLSGPAGDNWALSTSRKITPFSLYNWHSGYEPESKWGDSSLESLLFTNLPPSTNLTFWSWYNFVPGSPVDGGIVEINSGGGWIQVFPAGGYDDTLLTGFQNPLGGLEAFTYSSSGWKQKRIDLSAYAGQDIKIRFRVGWNNINEGPREGWYIDNIILQSDDLGWNAVIPGSGFPTTVYYYINATDFAGNQNDTETFSHIAGSDLILTQENLKLHPDALENGSSVTIEAEISNTGGSLSNVEVKFFLEDPDTNKDNILDGSALEIGTPAIIDIGTDDNKLVSTIWTPPDIGFYDIYVWVDAMNTSWEFDELNNLVHKTLSVNHWADSFDDDTKAESMQNVTYYNGDASIGSGDHFDFDNSDEGFVLENDEPNSQFYWDSIGKNVYFIANNTDLNDEMFTKPLFGPIDENTGSWTLSGRLMITARGVWQEAVPPFFIANSANTEILNTPNAISFEYFSTGNAIRGLYTDSTGTERIVITQQINLDTEYHVKGIYDKITKKLTLQILDDTDVVLAKDSYIIGTNPSDGFTFGKLGVGANGSSKSPYSLCTGWIDDLNFTLIGPIYQKGILYSIPLTPPSDGQWIAMYINKTEPVNTYLNVTIIDAISGNPIPGFTDITDEYIDITGIDPVTYPSIKLLADFTCYGEYSPKLHYWGINTDFSVFNIPLYKGWNMISLPFSKSITGIEGIFESVNYVAVQWYDASDTNDPWKHYHINKVGLNDLTEIDKAMGIWVYMASNDVLTVTGIPPNPTNIQLKTGWNFIGYPSLTSRLITDALSGIPYDVVEHYNASEVTDPWESTQQGDLVWMSPGEGYWIHVTTDCTWTVNW